MNNVVQIDFNNVNATLNTRVDTGDLMARIRNAADNYIERMNEFKDENDDDVDYDDVLTRFIDCLENDINSGII